MLDGGASAPACAHAIIGEAIQSRDSKRAGVFMYKCAIGYAGVYDIKADTAKDDNSKQNRSFFTRTRGDEAMQTEQSPLTHIKKLDVPMLLIHGKADHTADFEQFQMADAAMKKAGKNYETLVKADEGHGFYRSKDVEEAYNRMKAFILKYNPPN